MAWVTGSAIARLVELNGRHAHSYSQEALTDMLHEALAKQEARRQ